MTHTLSCGTVGLVIARHNKICDEILYLAQLALTPASVLSEPLVHQYRTRSEKEIRQGSEEEK